MTSLQHSYNGFLISQEADGYVSLTDMAKASGKRVNDYLENKATNEYLAGLSDDTGIPVSSLIHTVRGKGKNQGTWAHPEIAIDFAQWCSVPFRIWANRTLKKEIQSQLPQKAAIHVYADRVMNLDSHLISVPDNYWIVMQHCGHILLKVEKLGYPVGSFDLVDGSIGIRYRDYRKEIKLSESVVKKAWYKGTNQSPSPVPVNSYPYEELGIFAKWLETIYVQKHLETYLLTKYKHIVKL